MLSAGMLTSFADSMAAFRRMLPLGSPPPFLAATVISRRIFENSLPRWTSALPFLRLICDHRECPDIALSSFVGECGLEPLHALDPPIPPRQRGRPAPPLALRPGGERPARLRAKIPAEVHVRKIRRAGVPHLAAPRLLRQDLHADLERRGADVVQPGLERDH